LRNAAARNARAAPAAIESGAIHWGRPGGSLLSARRSDSGRGGPRRNAWLAAATSLVAGAAIAVAAIALLPRFPSAPGAAPSSPLLAQGYVDRADVAYQTFARALNPVEFGAEQKDELSSALAARVGFAPAPDLASTGLRLLGGRLTPGLRGPAGLLIYENATGARVALYFERAEAGPIPFVAPRVEQGLLAAEWRAAGMAFVLIGPLEANAMQRAAERAAADILARAAGETPKP
jgi:anti-sigma factor RsiW